MIVECRCIVKGEAKGYAIVSNKPINLLSMIDNEGRIVDKQHDLYNNTLKDKILVFPYAIGSSVGAYKLYRLKVNNLAPRAIVCKEADIITVSGCAISNIPLLDKPKCKWEDIKGFLIIKGSMLIININNINKENL